MMVNVVCNLEEIQINDKAHIISYIQNVFLNQIPFLS